MQPKMEVIETYYNGITYRSRTEARWAVFMTSLDVVFDYEPEAFTFRGTGYLPDFFLPMQDCYMEIKGIKPTNIEECKASQQAIGDMFHVTQTQIKNIKYRRSWKDLP